MSKTNTILMLAVAALPAAFVMYLLVMAFLGSFETMPGMLKGIVALTLVCCAVVVLLPVYVAVSGPKSEKAVAKPQKGAAPAEEAAAATDEADLEEAEAEEEFIADEVAAEEAEEEEEDLFAAGDDEEFDYLEEEPPKQ